MKREKDAIYTTSPLQIRTANSGNAHDFSERTQITGQLQNRRFAVFCGQTNILCLYLLYKVQ